MSNLNYVDFTENSGSNSYLNEDDEPIIRASALLENSGAHDLSEILP